MATGVTELAATLQDVRIFGVEHRVRERLDGLVESASPRQQSTDRMSGLITVVYQGSAMALVVGALAVAYAANFSELSSLGAMALIMIRASALRPGVADIPSEPSHLCLRTSRLCSRRKPATPRPH